MLRAFWGNIVLLWFSFLAVLVALLSSQLCVDVSKAIRRTISSSFQLKVDVQSKFRCNIELRGFILLGFSKISMPPHSPKAKPIIKKTE